MSRHARLPEGIETVTVIGAGTIGASWTALFLAAGLEVDEIARAAFWLLSDEASYVTGAILDASGGWVMP